jgi:hypothetical protein
MSFLQDKFGVYDDFIALLQRMYKKDSTKDYVKRALEIFERKQGRIFLEGMGKSGARHFAGLPPEVKTRENQLEEEVEKLQTTVTDARAEASRGPALQALEARLGEKRADQQALKEEIKTHYSHYYALKYPRPASLAEQLGLFVNLGT